MEILKWKVDGQKNNLTKNVVFTIFFWNYHCKNRRDKIMAETIMILKGDATHMIKEVSVYMLYRDGKKSKLLRQTLEKNLQKSMLTGKNIALNFLWRIRIFKFMEHLFGGDLLICEDFIIFFVTDKSVW